MTEQQRPEIAPQPLSADDVMVAVATWLCEEYEDDEGGGCEPEAGSPCIGHVQEAIARLDATYPPGAQS